MKPGDTRGRYVIEALLGKGGMGEVFEALDTQLGRKVALKLLPAGANAEATARLVREARAAAAFHHPNAVVVFDAGELDGEPYIAMELVRGRALRAFVGDDEVPIARRVAWLVDVARALAAAHKAGLVHRDVKPDNVMVDDDGAVKVLDFGIARRPAADVDPSAPTEASSGALHTLTEAGVVVGTPLYASPEQLRGEPLDGRSDQFSFGVLAYQLLSGALPWKRTGDAVALLSQVLTTAPDDLGAVAPAVAPEVAAVVMRALAKDRGARFSSMSEVAVALAPFSEAATSSGERLYASGLRAAAATAPTLAAGHTPQPTARTLAQRTGRVALVGSAVFGVLVAATLGIAAALGGVRVEGLGAHHADAAAPAGAEITGVACEDATIEGDDQTPLMRSAIGVGACARLATTLDVDWKVAGAPKLVVAAKLAKDHAHVELAIAGARGAGDGPTPVDAMTAAIAGIQPKLRVPKLSAAEVQAWGATDEASARRIEGLWRKLVLNMVPDDEAAARELARTDPGSPWPYFVEAIGSANRGTPEQEEARTKALELTAKLPAARAAGLRGVLHFVGAGRDHDAALEELRRSYRDAPDDADVAGLYAAVAIAVGAEEGFAVLDRLVAKFPTRSMVPLENAVTAPRERDLDRDLRYLEILRATLPETVAWYPWAQQLAARGKIDEARAALAFADRFGLASASGADAANLIETRAFVELAAFEPARAREIAQPLLSDPRPQSVRTGAELVASSYMLEGRFDDALEAQRREIDRARSFSGPVEFAQHVLTYGFQLRYLGQPPMAPSIVDEAAQRAEDARFLPPASRAVFRALFAYLRSSPDPKKAKVELAPTLRELEATADAASDRTARDSLRAALVPLVRVVRGDAEAAASWRAASRASSTARQGSALEAGFALEHSGAPEEAAKAFAEAEGAFAARTPFRRMIAELHLAEVYRAAGRADDAAKADAVVARLWGKVDPAVLARLRKL